MTKSDYFSDEVVDLFPRPSLPIVESEVGFVLQHQKIGYEAGYWLGRKHGLQIGLAAMLIQVALMWWYLG